MASNGEDRRISRSELGWSEREGRPIYVRPAPLREEGMAEPNGRDITHSIEAVGHQLELHDQRTRGYAERIDDTIVRLEGSFKSFEQTASQMNMSINNLAVTMNRVARLVFWIAVVVGGERGLELLSRVWP